MPLEGVDETVGPARDLFWRNEDGRISFRFSIVHETSMLLSMADEMLYPDSGCS